MASKDMRQLISKLESQGWDASQRRRGGHWRLASPRGQIAFLPNSPSDHRSIRNAVSFLRKLGARV